MLYYGELTLHNCESCLKTYERLFLLWCWSLKSAGNWEEKMCMKWEKQETVIETDDPEAMRMDKSPHWPPVTSKPPTLIMGGDGQGKLVCFVTELNTLGLGIDKLKGEIWQCYCTMKVSQQMNDSVCEWQQCLVTWTNVLSIKRILASASLWPFRSHTKCVLWPVLTQNFWET